MNGRSRCHQDRPSSSSRRAHEKSRSPAPPQRHGGYHQQRFLLWIATALGRREVEEGFESGTVIQNAGVDQRDVARLPHQRPRGTRPENRRRCPPARRSWRPATPMTAHARRPANTTLARCRERISSRPSKTPNGSAAHRIISSQPHPHIFSIHLSPTVDQPSAPPLSHHHPPQPRSTSGMCLICTAAS